MTVETKKNAVDEASWHLIDANGETLGRLASRIAILLMGKHKPTYVPYLHVGDVVIVVNAQKILVTGDKLAQKKYYRYSGYRGGIFRAGSLTDGDCYLRPMGCVWAIACVCVCNGQRDRSSNYCLPLRSWPGNTDVDHGWDRTWR